MKYTNEEKKIRRGVIEELFILKNRLLKSNNPYIELSRLVAILRSELLEERIDKDLFFDSIGEIYCYTRDNSIFGKNMEKELHSMQSYFIEKSRPIDIFLKKADKDSFYPIEGKKFLESFKKGNYTGKTVMEFTLFLLNFTRVQSVSDIGFTFRIFEVYIRDFLVPRNLKSQETQLREFLNPRNFKSEDEENDLKINKVVKYISWCFHTLTGGKFIKYISSFFRIPEKVIEGNLKPTKKSKKNNFVSLKDQVVKVIDDLIEIYIEIAKPSVIFLSNLEKL